MTIAENEEELFQRWQKNRDGFVRDGVVSESDYLASNPKLMFILKEVNDPGGGGWDLREFVYEGGRSQTWNNIARWVHGIRNLSAIQDWYFYENISSEFRMESLRDICAINLKKSPGTHTADMSSLWEVANEDKQLIQEQYSFYNPDLTICGGTGDLFKSVVGHEPFEWKRTSRGIMWYEREAKKYVIRFSHPEARCDSCLLMYGLLDAVKEICA